MKLNRVLEYFWPQNTASDIQIWEVRQKEDGSLYISQWNEELAGRPQPTDAELDQLGADAETAIAKESRIAEARRELEASDWRMTVDKSAAMEPEALEAWKQYRAKLRDVVNGISDVLPKKPEAK